MDRWLTCEGLTLNFVGRYGMLVHNSAGMDVFVGRERLKAARQPARVPLLDSQGDGWGAPVPDLIPCWETMRVLNISKSGGLRRRAKNITEPTNRQANSITWMTENWSEGQSTAARIISFLKVDVYCLDSQKVLESMNHRLLYQIEDVFKAVAMLITWITLSLKDRCFRLSWGSSVRHRIAIDWEPSGSLLGSPLFLLYVKHNQ